MFFGAKNLFYVRHYEFNTIMYREIHLRKMVNYTIVNPINMLEEAVLNYSS